MRRVHGRALGCSNGRVMYASFTRIGEPFFHAWEDGSADGDIIVRTDARTDV